LPLGSLAIAIFVTFKMKKEAVYEEFISGSTKGAKLFNAWFFLVKYVLPIIIIAVLLSLLVAYSKKHSSECFFLFTLQKRDFR
ncbi:hypothetical protein VSS86_22055, partial [Bacillus safensis]|nr:hypothetical protein [Bacillus safensis]